MSNKLIIINVIYFLISLLNVKVYSYQYEKVKKPNIVIILADDLGFNDVSFHGSDQIFTPNIDSLGYSGVILNRYYVPAMCTPSRAALLTGRYPIHNGMQHFVIPSDEPWGLPLTEVTLPQILKSAGYSTQIVGKWHLGFHKKTFTPTRRGFDSHIGYLGPYIDYFNHSLIMLDRNYAEGYDMRRNMSIDCETKGTYATDLFNDEAVNVIHNHDTSTPLFLYVSHLAPHTGNENDPMQAPEEEINKYDHIKDPKRRIYAAMVSKLDEGVGKIMEALYRKNMLDNTIVLFYADNGGPSEGMHSNTGSNYPLRGQKNSPWEGGVRSAGVIWSRLLERKQRVSKELIYVTDWLPTFAALAGIKLNPSLRLDGLNIWDSLSKGYPTRRRNILHNIDEIIGYSSYMRGIFKYVNGSTLNGKYDLWLGNIPDERDPRTLRYSHEIKNSIVTQILNKIDSKFDSTYNQLTPEKINRLRSKAVIECQKSAHYIHNVNGSKYECQPLKSPCLFNIEADPCEFYNLAFEYPKVVERLGDEVESYRRTARKSERVPPDPNCNPAFFGNTWTWWQEFDVSAGHVSERDVISFILLSTFLFLCIFIISSFIFYHHLHYLRRKERHLICKP